MTNRLAAVRRRKILAESADHKAVPFRSVEAQNVHDRFACGGMDDLTNAEQRLAVRNREEIGNPVIGSRGVNFLIRVADLHFILPFEESEE